MILVQKIALTTVEPWSFKINICLFKSVFECVYMPQSTISWWSPQILLVLPPPHTHTRQGSGITMAFLWHTPVINLWWIWGRKPFPQLRSTERINLLLVILSEMWYCNPAIDWNLALLTLLPLALCTCCLIRDDGVIDFCHSQGLEVALVFSWVRLS